jgi:hypothetical protein
MPDVGAVRSPRFVLPGISASLAHVYGYLDHDLPGEGGEWVECVGPSREGGPGLDEKFFWTSSDGTPPPVLAMAPRPTPPASTILGPGAEPTRAGEPVPRDGKFPEVLGIRG